MTVSLDDMMAGLDPARRRKIEDRTAELIAEEMTLRELRKARQLTQVGVDGGLGCAKAPGEFCLRQLRRRASAYQRLDQLELIVGSRVLTRGPHHGGTP